MTSIETERLTLRTFRESDAEALHRLSLEPSTREAMYDEACETTEDALALIRSVGDDVPHYPVALAICLKSDGALIGHVSLSPCREDIEIGYAIAEGQRGRDYAVEAVAAFAAWSLQRLPSVIGEAKASNAASCRVLERVGFMLEFAGDLPSFGGVNDVRVYRRVANPLRP